MKNLLEYIPLFAFFIAYYVFDVYVATSVLIGATALQLIMLKVLFKEIERKNWIIFSVVTVFGALTLYFHDDDFIKLKATIIYCVFFCVLLGYQYVGNSLPKKLMGQEMNAPDYVWRNVSYGWAATCLLAAVLNYWIAFNLSLDAWVNFKVFGIMGIIFTMFIATGFYLYKYMPQDSDDTSTEVSDDTTNNSIQDKQEK